MPIENVATTIEVLHGIRINDESIDIFVTSNGCTSKDNIRIEVDKGFTGMTPVSLTVVRSEPDTCKMMSHVAQLTFTKAELGIEGRFDFTLTNKLGNTSSGR